MGAATNTSESGYDGTLKVDRGGAALHQGVEPDRLPQIGHDSRAERSLLGAGGTEDGGRREG